MTIVSSQPKQVAQTGVPVLDIDPYSDEVLIEPWDAYRQLQDLGAAVWLARYQMFALSRVRQCGQGLGRPQCILVVS
jgi:hypothetical protein